MLAEVTVIYTVYDIYSLWSAYETIYVSMRMYFITQKNADNSEISLFIIFL